jgi:hypothetical protein
MPTTRRTNKVEAEGKAKTDVDLDLLADRFHKLRINQSPTGKPSEQTKVTLSRLSNKTTSTSMGQMNAYEIAGQVVGDAIFDGTIDVLMSSQHVLVKKMNQKTDLYLFCLPPKGRTTVIDTLKNSVTPKWMSDNRMVFKNMKDRVLEFKKANALNDDEEAPSPSKSPAFEICRGHSSPAEGSSLSTLSSFTESELAGMYPDDASSDGENHQDNGNYRGGGNPLAGIFSKAGLAVAMFESNTPHKNKKKS